MNLISVKDASGAKSGRLMLIRDTLLLSLRKMKIRNVCVDVTLIQDSEMKKLNRKYRGKNKPTDVLSFSQKDMFLGKKKVLGDIIIAKETTRKQAIQAGHKINEEYKLLSIHGLLHLLGYDHEKKYEEIIMFNLQAKLLNYARKL